MENAARGNHRYRRHGIDNLRHQRHRADLAAIAARLATLRDDHIDCSFSSLNGLRDRSDLQHHPRADSVGLPHPRAMLISPPLHAAGRVCATVVTCSITRAPTAWACRTRSPGSPSVKEM